MSELFKFQWERDPAGYRIIDTDEWGRCIAPSSNHIEHYDPWRIGSESLVLFQILAETPKNEEGYLKFANSYGLLTGREAEPLDTWYVKIDSLRIAVENWREGEFPVLIDTFSNHGFTQISVRLVEVVGFDRPQLFVTPDTLYTALWIQFAEAISADLKIRECAWCGKPFPYGPGTGRRTTATYCSPKCQKAHSYKKRLEQE